MSRPPLALPLLGLSVGLALLIDPTGADPALAAPRGESVRVEHRDPDTAPSRGPASAPVTIELFFHPLTNAQARLPVYRALEKLQANHPARIRVIYRIVKRSGQVQLPTAALEAHAQGKFLDFMEELHRNKTTSTLGRPEVLDLARKIGMDAQRLSAAISNDRYRDVLEANDRRHERLLRGQPSIPSALFNTKPVRTSLTSMSDADYEREYADAYERAMELIDRGVDPRYLLEAFDAQVLRSEQPFVVSTGPTDEEGSGEPPDHKLASPPLDLTGMPSNGKPGARATMPVVVLCRPNDTACGNTLRGLSRLVGPYADEVRVVWAPWFDVSRDDAAELTMLGDAALCAEQIGSSPDDLGASPGWRWIDRQLQRSSRSHGRRSPPEKLIDDVTTEVDIDPQKLSACRARMANTTLDWIERARKSGVTRAPALVIGGRIYEGIPDQAIIQQLIESELAPGVLGEVAPGWRMPR